MTRPIKKYKSLDDEEILKFADDIEEKEEDIASELTEIDRNDTTEDIVVNTINGDSISSPTVELRSNPPTSRSWADDKILKHKIGEIVSIKGGSNVAKIIGPGKKENTYFIKYSGSSNFSEIEISNVKKAKKNVTWLDYWQTIIDPYTEWKNKKDKELKKTKIKEKKFKKTKRK